MTDPDDSPAFNQDSVRVLQEMEARAEAVIDAKAHLISLVDSQKETQAALAALDLALAKKDQEDVWTWSGTIFIKQKASTARSQLAEEMKRIEQEIANAREDVRQKRNDLMSLEATSMGVFGFNLRPLSPEELAFLDQKV